jgi:hypothetical protein
VERVGNGVRTYAFDGRTFGVELSFRGHLESRLGSVRIAEKVEVQVLLRAHVISGVVELRGCK